MSERPKSVDDIKELIDQWSESKRLAKEYAERANTLSSKIHIAPSQVLEEILNSRKLHVCYYDHLFTDQRSFSEMDPNNLADFGVFPRSELRLLYCDWEERSGSEMYPPDGYISQVHELRVLCPKHFGTSFRKNISIADEFKGRQVEVTIQGNQVIQVPEGEILPHLPIRTMRQAYSRLDKYHPHIYQLFDVPTLADLGFNG